jgi:hypothetical protein
MYNVVENPIPQNNLFGTPASLEDLLKFCTSSNASETRAMMFAATLALNWAHAQVEKEILSKEIFAG